MRIFDTLMARCHESRSQQLEIFNCKATSCCPTCLARTSLLPAVTNLETAAKAASRWPPSQRLLKVLRRCSESLCSSSMPIRMSCGILCLLEYLGSLHVNGTGQDQTMRYSKSYLIGNASDRNLGPPCCACRTSSNISTLLDLWRALCSPARHALICRWPEIEGSFEDKG